jgi:hypothetical protein
VKQWIPAYVRGETTYPRLADAAFVVAQPHGALVLWMVGQDGTVWYQGPDPANPSAEFHDQVAGPGNLVRVAAADDGSAWFTAPFGALWHLTTGREWRQVPEVVGPLVDVAVWRGTVLVARDDGAVFQTRDGITFVDHSSLAPFQRLAGTSQGVMWGIGQLGEVWSFLNGSFWEPASGIGVEERWVDVSISLDGGLAYLCREDGSVWTTSDGVLYSKLSDGDFVSLAAVDQKVTFAVQRAGTLWQWVDVHAPLPPAPPEPPPTHPPVVMPPGTPRPHIDVSATGAGDTTVFHVTGTGFAGSAATVRGARIADGQIVNAFWPAPVSGGAITTDIALPCAPGLVISFSANDGRHDPDDLPLGVLWSNTVPATCP